MEGEAPAGQTEQLQTAEVGCARALAILHPNLPYKTTPGAGKFLYSDTGISM